MTEKYVLLDKQRNDWYPGNAINNAERFDVHDYNRLKNKLTEFDFYKIEDDGSLTRMPMGR